MDDRFRPVESINRYMSSFLSCAEGWWGKGACGGRWGKVGGRWGKKGEGGGEVGGKHVLEYIEFIADDSLACTNPRLFPFPVFFFFFFSPWVW
jgi:hypothetical protein